MTTAPTNEMLALAEREALEGARSELVLHDGEYQHRTKASVFAKIDAALSNLDAAAPAAGGDELTPAQISIANDMFKAWVDDPKFRQAFRDDCKRLVDAPPLQAPAHSDAVREAFDQIITSAMSWQPSEDGPSYMEKRADLEAMLNAALTAPAAKERDDRACTCHPDDNPPQPCQRQFAYSECVNAAKSGDDGLLAGTYPQPIEHYQRVAKNLAALWSDGNRGAETAILASLLRAAKAPAVSEADVGRFAVADQMIGQIEERFPNWQSYRDLTDCIDCTLHELRKDKEYATSLIQSAAQGGGTESDGVVEGHKLSRSLDSTPDPHGRIDHPLHTESEAAGIKPGPSDPPSQEASAPKGGEA